MMPGGFTDVTLHVTPVWTLLAMPGEVLVWGTRALEGCSLQTGAEIRHLRGRWRDKKSHSLEISSVLVALPTLFI